MENRYDNYGDQPLSNFQKGKYRLDRCLLIVLLVLVGLTGRIPETVQQVGIIAIAALLSVLGKIYLVYPAMLFYGTVLGLFAGMSVYRWFTLLFLGITLVKSKSIRITYKQFCLFLLFAVYCIVVLATEDIRSGVFTLVDFVCILLLVNCYLRDSYKFKEFFFVYVICAFLAYFANSDMHFYDFIDGEYVKMLRNMATFEDPNYMGFFYTSAIFSVIGLKLFTEKVRIIVVVALYAILLTSLSITAVLVNILLWIAYLWITKSLNPKVLLVVILVMMLALGLFQYGLQNPDAHIVGPLAMRISEKMKQTASGDIGSATTGRWVSMQRHLVFFGKQPVYKILIGMNAVNSKLIVLDGLGAAHNEYIDWLLNVGILGTIFMLYYLISTTWKPLTRYWRDRTDRYALSVTMLKLVFACYAFTLTVFGDYRFMLFMMI